MCSSDLLIKKSPNAKSTAPGVKKETQKQLKKLESAKKTLSPSTVSPKAKKDDKSKSHASPALKPKESPKKSAPVKKTNEPKSPTKKIVNPQIKKQAPVLAKNPLINQVKILPQP